MGLEFAAALLPLWDFPPGTGITPAGEQGTSNRTFLVRHGQQRYVLRASGFLSVAEVRAEHRILRRLRQTTTKWLRSDGRRAPATVKILAAETEPSRSVAYPWLGSNGTGHRGLCKTPAIASEWIAVRNV